MVGQRRMTHDELVDVGTRAMYYLFERPGTATNREYAAAVVEAVEPLIRADEQERHGNNCGGMWDEWTHDLHAQVKAMGFPQDVLMHTADLHSEWLEWRDEVLALLEDDE